MFKNALTKRVVGFAAMGLVVFMAGGVEADNIVPPPWVGSDPAFETFQEWEFHTEGPIAPDGEIPTVNSGGVPLATPFASMYKPLGDEPHSMLDGYIGIDGGILFDIPNIHDNRPIKLIRIQINGVWDVSNKPTVLSIFTGDFGTPGFAEGTFIASDETFPGFHRWEDWSLIPNPNFEHIFLGIPPELSEFDGFGNLISTTPGAFVNQVVIHTISIPEPGTALVVAGLGGLMFGVIRRRGSGN